MRINQNYNPKKIDMNPVKISEISYNLTHCNLKKKILIVREAILVSGIQ
jgi:hypothetical protein